MSVLAAVDRPFGPRFRRYLDERFPIVSHTLLIVPFFFSSYLLAARLNGHTPAPIDWRTIGGLVTVWMLFLLLRIFDEFKDAEHDRRHHPERPVPRGLVTLTELRRVGIGALAVAFAGSALASLPAFLAFLAALAFALLMAKEFFVSEWLKRDIFVYALTHQGIMPLLAAYAWLVGAAPGHGWDGLFLLHLGGCVGTGLGFEMARKMRGPDGEIAGEDSYTKRFGTMGAALLCSALMLAACACGVALGQALALPWWYHAALAVAALAVINGTIAFCRLPDARSSKTYGLLASIALLLYYVALTAGLVTTTGLRFAL